MMTNLKYNRDAGRWMLVSPDRKCELHAGDTILAYVPESNSPFCHTYIWKKVRIEYSWSEKSWFVVSPDGTPILEELCMLQVKTHDLMLLLNEEIAVNY